MSRQLEQAGEERERSRRLSVVRALEYGLVAALENQAAELKGFSVRYEEHSCLLTLRADINGRRHVAFVYADSMMNCIIRADREAASNRLGWQQDKYHNGQS